MPFERAPDFCLKKKQLENALVFSGIEFDSAEMKRSTVSDIFHQKLFRTNLVTRRTDLALLTDDEIAQNGSVLAIFNMLIANVLQIKFKQDFNIIYSRINAENIPIVSYTVSYDKINTLTFHTKRKNEKVQVDVSIRKYAQRFCDKDKAERSDEYSIRILIHKKLANPDKFKQDFSQFLSSGKHIIDFIYDTVWPCIDTAVKEVEQKVQKTAEQSTSFHRNNRNIDDQNKHSQRSIPRDHHQKYSSRGDNHRENNKENTRMNRNLENGQENRREKNRENNHRENNNRSNYRDNHNQENRIRENVRENQHQQGDKTASSAGEWSRKKF